MIASGPARFAKNSVDKVSHGHNRSVAYMRQSLPTMSGDKKRFCQVLSSLLSWTFESTKCAFITVRASYSDCQRGIVIDIIDSDESSATSILPKEKFLPNRLMENNQCLYTVSKLQIDTESKSKLSIIDRIV